MKYLVNTRTKEHRIYDESQHGDLPNHKYRVAQADSEGWIKHDGGECPLPDEGWVHVKHRDGLMRAYRYPRVLSWNHKGMDSAKHPVAYRPILGSKPVCHNVTQEEYDSLVKQGAFDNKPDSVVSESLATDLIERLKTAHQSAAELPDIVAELRAQLEPLGYDLVARDPFVDLDAPPFERVPDMSDWRNWREGDLVECKDSTEGYTEGGIYKLREDPANGKARTVTDDKGSVTNGWTANHFRFHSRPTGGHDNG